MSTRLQVLVRTDPYHKIEVFLFTLKFKTINVSLRQKNLNLELNNSIFSNHPIEREMPLKVS